MSLATSPRDTVCDPPPPPDMSESPTAAISNAVVAVLREHTGRGPTHARTTIAADMIVVTLRNCLTKGERTLAHGDHRIVLAMRRALHDAMRPELTRAVQRLSGRHVNALLTDSSLDPDITVAVFLLEPGGDAVIHPKPRSDGRAGPAAHRSGLTST